MFSSTKWCQVPTFPVSTWSKCETKTFGEISIFALVADMRWTTRGDLDLPGRLHKASASSCWVLSVDFGAYGDNLCKIWNLHRIFPGCQLPTKKSRRCVNIFCLDRFIIKVYVYSLWEKNFCAYSKCLKSAWEALCFFWTHFVWKPFATNLESVRYSVAEFHLEHFLPY